MTPKEAHATYSDAETNACEKYRLYWVERFGQVGVVLSSTGWYGQLAGQFSQYRITASVRPAAYEGIKIEVHSPATITIPYDHWHAVRVKSDTGLSKLIRKLNMGSFK